MCEKFFNRRNDPHRKGLSEALKPIIAGAVLVGFVTMMLLVASCMIGPAPAGHHHHSPPHHQHTPLCEWAHSVGAVFLVFLGASLIIFFQRKRNPFQLDSVSPHLLIGLPLFGRAPPLLSL